MANTKTRIVRKKVKKRKKWLLFLIPLLIIALGIGVYAWNIINKAEEIVSNSYEEDGREKSDLRDSRVDPNVDDVSILFIGVDESEKRGNESNGLSDALILATLNKDEKNVKLLSIPRDSYVYIPEVGYETKINHAHSFGGPKATIETVENLLDIPVDYFVKVNFEAFIDVVDTLNGIEVEVPYEMTEQDSQDKAGAIHLMPGVQTLNGEEALALARTRKQDNDIERGKRQQEIIKAIVNKAVSFDSILRVDDLMESVGDNMTTSMSFDELTSFISYGTTGELTLETLNLEGTDSWESVYYFILDPTDLEEKRNILKEQLNLPTTDTETNTESDSETWESEPETEPTEPDTWQSETEEPTAPESDTWQPDPEAPAEPETDTWQPNQEDEQSEETWTPSDSY
ncbi:LCP family glycopolymer transferase [Gracilibacillus alcaliphilus]|uniref:LCP family glycopolymer transferase n=1 Tax=Gracilibacillus alcaliphilus TaxID=1401441 RepID=UPI00195DE024|nr:LCP family protein required for cell wall assembly [Gracilibacillus alcaliphilus]